MTFVVVNAVRSSLAARLDMVVPSLKVDTRLYAGNRCFVTAIQAIRSMPAGHGGHKKASRVAPARGTYPVGDQIRTRDVRTPASGRCRPHGSRRSTD